ncbi:MAG: NF038122 family metalloprotease [Phycisphaerales bacterium]
MAIGSAIVSPLLVLVAVSCTGQHGAVTPSDRTELMPTRIVVQSNGTVETEFQRVPSGTVSTRIYARQDSVPVVSFDRDGNERPGIWTTVPFGPGTRFAPSVTVPIMVYRSTIGTHDERPVHEWRVLESVVLLSHPPSTPGWERMVPGSDTAILSTTYDINRRTGLHGMIVNRGCAEVVQFDTSAPSFRPQALGAVQRVEARLNKLLRLASNMQASCINLRVEFDDLGNEPGMGDPPPGPPKAMVMVPTIPVPYNTIANFLRVTNGGGVPDDSLDTGENNFFNDLPGGSGLRAVIGPAPGTVDPSVDTVLVPVAINALRQFGGASMTIEFSNTMAWDYNAEDGVAAGACDFEAVLMHESLHALGFISNADQGAPFDALTVLDWYRFDTADTGSTVSSGEFAGGDPRSVVAVANPIMTQNHQTPAEAYRMSSGHTTVPPGDGRMSGHWKDDVFTSTLIGIMDPTIGGGRSPLFPNYLTNADTRALDLIGWHIADDPVNVLLALANPAPGVMPVADATGVPTEPTFVWQPPTPGPNTLPGVTLVVYADPLGPNNPDGAQPAFRADDLTGSSFTLPDGILSTGTTCSWTTVTSNPWSFTESGPYAFTTQGPPPCPADVNGDGVVDPSDFSAWIASYNAGC